jgi:hypothetical protein
VNWILWLVAAFVVLLGAGWLRDGVLGHPLRDTGRGRELVYDAGWVTGGAVGALLGLGPRAIFAVGLGMLAWDYWRLRRGSLD